MNKKRFRLSHVWTCSILEKVAAWYSFIGFLSRGDKYASFNFRVIISVNLCKGHRLVQPSIWRPFDFGTTFASSTFWRVCQSCRELALLLWSDNANGVSKNLLIHLFADLAVFQFDVCLSLMKISHVISHMKNIWKWNIFTYEIPNSHVKWTGSKFHRGNLWVQDMCFTYKIEDSSVKINFTYEIFISRMELKQFTYGILFLYVRLSVKFL